VSASAQAALNRVLNSVAYAKRRKDTYIHTIEVVPLAASAGAGTGSVQISDDGDFLAVFLTATVRLAADHTTIVANPAVLVSIKDSGAGRDFMDKAVDIGNLAGTAQLPLILPYPKFFERATNLTATVQNLAATAYDLRISIHGVKLFG
jgi:hypothetical protein